MSIVTRSATAAPGDARRAAWSLLLNVAHAIDHWVLLIFATAVSTIAADFGFARWEDLMPYATGAFFAFGIGSLPAGKLGDSWGRRPMMLAFFFGLGASLLLVAASTGPWQIAIALTIMGVFSAIYHPVGIPMLVRDAARPGRTIGINGLAGNLGIALAAITTGALVKYFGWRMAFVVPGLLSIACGLLFARVAPREELPPTQRKPSKAELPRGLLARVFAVITITATTGSLIFNFTTNGNAELLRERMAAIATDPFALGVLLALVYAIASLAQLVVGHLIDRVPMKRLLLAIVALQVALLSAAAHAHGWLFFALCTLFMAAVFGAIPFIDAMIVRFVDDRIRSRVAGARLAISFGISSLAVYLLGPVVKASGFDFLLLAMAGVAVVTFAAASLLPGGGRT
ncbi:MFS transporter [Betaproteobacteria bacterium PRO7]|jgi:MFS family permease|nr:MFS transporter [Betaproteobacteria bacterium PRO7]GIL04171.1 MAG: MFS transporter [Betaproteobacteria bacterium]